jgi:hypothetical protein
VTPEYRIPVSSELAKALRLTDDTNKHRPAPAQIAIARNTITGTPAGVDLTGLLAGRLRESGWAVLTLPGQRNDQAFLRVAAGLLAAVGDPFPSAVPPEGGVWLRGESRREAGPASLGGFGGQPLHIDAPGAERPPDYTALLMLRPDPAGGGACRIANLRQAAAKLTTVDRELLSRAVFYESRADKPRGVGRPRLPFPVLEPAPDGAGWIRWAGSLLTDPRNQQHRPVLLRFGELLEPLTRRIWLSRGHLLVLDQRQVAHGRDPLGDQRTVKTPKRLLCQADVRAAAAAPVQQALAARADTDAVSAA